MKNTRPFRLVVVIAALVVMGVACDLFVSEGDPCEKSEENTYTCKSDDVLECLPDGETDELVWTKVDSCPDTMRCSLGSGGDSYSCTERPSPSQPQSNDENDGDSDETDSASANCLDECDTSADCVSGLTCIDYGDGPSCYPDGCGDCADDGLFCDYTSEQQSDGSYHCSFNECVN